MRSAAFVTTAVLTFGLTAAAQATPFFFSTGDPNDLIATASRPASAGKIEIEAADDFVLTDNTTLTSASFTGLLPTGATVQNVVIEIYRAFPADSDLGRTTGAPVFSTSQVPTRVNSPSDIAIAERDAASSTLNFTTTTLVPSFSALNSILNGIHPLPNVFTGGDGAITGDEVRFDITFPTGLALMADHYFFVPQVQLASGDFFWLSAPKPIVPLGTPFPPGSTDLQSWIRNENLDPDWLKIGTDITHQGPFNAAFSLTGDLTNEVPEPGDAMIFAGALAGLGFWRRRSTKTGNAVKRL